MKKPPPGGAWGVRKVTEGEMTILEELKIRHKRDKEIKELVLALLQQCKDKNLTMAELERVLSIIKQDAMETTLRDGLILE